MDNKPRHQAIALNAGLIGGGLSSLILAGIALFGFRDITTSRWLILLMCLLIMIFFVVNRRSFSKQNPLFPAWPKHRRDRLVLIGPIFCVAFSNLAAQSVVSRALRFSSNQERHLTHQIVSSLTAPATLAGVWSWLLTVHVIDSKPAKV